VGVEAGVKLFVDGLPDTATMGVFGIIALLVNGVCFLLLSRYRNGDINLRATWICSRNDMLGNVGVLAAAGLVDRLDVLWPDIVIGLLIAAVVVRSAVRVVREARGELPGEK
jgi:Co/Zn/Cd efflux system component